jgi:hypothetical protein
VLPWWPRTTWSWFNSKSVHPSGSTRPRLSWRTGALPIETRTAPCWLPASTPMSRMSLAGAVACELDCTPNNCESADGWAAALPAAEANGSGGGANQAKTACALAKPAAAQRAI